MWNLPDNVIQRDIDRVFGSQLSDAAETRLEILQENRLLVAGMIQTLEAMSEDDEDGAYDDAIAKLQDETLASLNARIDGIYEWDAKQSEPDWDAIRDAREAA